MVDAAARGAHDALVILATTASSASEALALQAPHGPTNCPTATVVLCGVLVSGLSGAVAGLGLGSAQWLVLRRSVSSAGWWLVASCVGWTAGLSLGSGMLDLLGTPLSLLVVGVVSGAVTGSVLSALLAGPAPSDRAAVT